MQKKNGFVLILTLFILAAIAIVATYFSERVQKSLQLAELQQGQNDKQININNTRSEILFRLSTTYLSSYGLGPSETAIALDDRPYSNDGTTVQLQDSRGLININYASDEQLLRLLAILNVPPDQRQHLIDTLRDYIDVDNLRRLDGAEAPEYAALGMLPPRNSQLVSPMELKSVAGWRDTSSLWKDNSIAEFTTVSQANAINPNTASWQVLASLPGVTREIAQSIIVRRKLEPISVAFLDQMAGTNLNVFPPQAIGDPSDNIRVTQRAIGMPWAIRYNVQLTPVSDIAPWQITCFYRIEGDADPTRANSAVNVSENPKLPVRSILPSPATVLPIL